jgi:hypothetical protein
LTARRRKTDGGARRTDTTAAIDERIEHQCEELIGQLQRGAFGTRVGFAVQLRRSTQQRRTRKAAEA